MPILCSLNQRCVTDEEFRVIDKAVMRHAYDLQNQFGRLFDERVYENELADRLRADGFEVETQVPVTVSHGSFTKTYYLDLVVNHMLYELKVVEHRVSAHKTQCLHYAMLQNVRLVKLVNFGEKKVRGELFQNTLREADRHHPRLRNSGWHPRDEQCENLVHHLKSLLADWGTHLSSSLFNEALVHHFGGEAHCLQRVPVQSGERQLGTHLVQMHSQQAAFMVTSLSSGQSLFQRQLESVFKRIPVPCLQWINLNHARVEITTLEKGSDHDNGSRMRAAE